MRQSLGIGDKVVDGITTTTRGLLVRVVHAPSSICSALTHAIRAEYDRQLNRFHNRFFAPTVARVYQPRWNYDRRVRQLSKFIIDPNSDII